MIKKSTFIAMITVVSAAKAVIGLTLLYFLLLHPRGWTLDTHFSDSATCADYKFRKEVDQDQKTNWIVSKPHWSVFSEKVTSSKDVQPPAQINKVTCDHLSKEEERLRIDYFSGGTHCCSESYWLKEGEPDTLFIKFAHGNVNADERYKTDSNGNATFMVDDPSLTYFAAGKFSMSFAESFFLPLSVCFKDSEFYDCTLTQSNILERLKRVEEMLTDKSVSLSDKASSRLITAKVVEYIALSLLVGDNNYQLNLKRLGLNYKTIQELVLKVSDQITVRKQDYGKMPLDKIF